MIFARSALILASLLCASASSAVCGIVVNNDEWPLSDQGYALAGSTDFNNYVRNVAKLLTGKTSGAKIWLNSNNFGLTGNQLKAALANYALTATGTFSSFDLSTLQQYDAVFLAGDDITAAEQIALIMYVKAGGGLYIAAGTGTITGGGVGEAAQWNVILSEFSLNLADVYNLISGVLYTNSKSPILRGVTQLYYNNGNTVSVTGPGAQIITRDGTVGLIGVYSNSAVTP